MQYKTVVFTTFLLPIFTTLSTLCNMKPLLLAHFRVKIWIVLCKEEPNVIGKRELFAFEVTLF